MQTVVGAVASSQPSLNRRRLLMHVLIRFVEEKQTSQLLRQLNNDLQ